MSIRKVVNCHTQLLYREIALEIITSDHWEKAMRMCTENNMTPMRFLIIHMPGIQAASYKIIV